MNPLITSLKHYYPSQSPIFLYWKGRVALYALLKAMNLQAGDEVILPAYTCVVVPNAILYLGAKPIYIDINPETYNMNVSAIEPAITNKTKIIICQNTYGLSTDLEVIIEIAKRHHLYTIEDCTHGFGGTYNSQPNGTFCDSAFFSSQWNKPFSTGLGGFAIINNPTLIAPIEALEKEKKEPGFKDKIMLWMLLQVRRYCLTDKTYWFLRRLYRWLSKHNIVLGSSQGKEITSVQMPDHYFKNISNIQIKEGARALKNFKNIIAQRKKNALEFTRFLKAHQKTYVLEKYEDNHAFLRYPILVRDKDHFLNLAEKEKMPLGDWFISPLHPVESHFEQWHFDPKKYPVSVKIASQMVNLSTDISNINRVLHFLNKNMKEMI